MIYLKLGFDIFCKRILINLLLVFQLALALLSLNFSLAKTQSIRLGLSIIENIPNKHAVSVMSTKEIRDFKGYDYLDCSVLQGNYTVAESWSLFLESDTFGSVTSYLYAKPLVENIKIPLIKGQWTDKIITEGGTEYYPVVINSEYADLKYKDRTTLTTQDGIEFSVYVAGILNSNQLYLSLNMSGNVATSEFFFKKYIDRNGKPLFFFNNEAFPKDISEYNIFPEISKFVFFDPAMSEEMFQDNVKSLSDQVYTYDLDTLLNNSYAEYRETLRYYMPICICIYAIGLIGIISFTALNTLENAHYFSILYLCGSRWKNCKYICLGYIGIIALLSIILTLFLHNIALFFEIFDITELYFTYKNIVLTGTVIAIAVMISMLIPFVLMKKFSVSEFIRKFER